MGLINLLIYLLILACIIGVLWWGFNQIPLPGPVRTGFIVVVCIIVVLALAGLLTGGYTVPTLIR